MERTELIEKLRELDAKATPAPWGMGHIERGCIAGKGGAGTVVVRDTNQKSIPSKANADLIIALRNALPQLLEALASELQREKPICMYCDGCGWVEGGARSGAEGGQVSDRDTSHWKCAKCGSHWSQSRETAEKCCKAGAVYVPCSCARCVEAYKTLHSQPERSESAPLAESCRCGHPHRMHSPNGICMAFLCHCSAGLPEALRGSPLPSAERPQPATLTTSLDAIDAELIDRLENDQKFALGFARRYAESLRSSPAEAPRETPPFTPSAAALEELAEAMAIFNCHCEGYVSETMNPTYVGAVNLLAAAVARLLAERREPA